MAFDAADVSVVIPVGNGSRLITEVVGAVLAAVPAPGEVVVVDDRVTDCSLKDVAGDGRVRVVPNDGPKGPAAARNAGARAATLPVLLFIDADVVVKEGFFAALAGAYGEGEDGVLGVEAEVPTLPNLASRYKNLWMRYTYINLPRRVDLFYTSCASIKRGVFLDAGGFDEGYARPSVEDTAFGWVLGSRRTVLAVEKTLEVEHRKTYNTWGVVATAFRRGAALARCVLRMGRRGSNRSSVPTTLIWSLPFAAAFPCALALIAWEPAWGAAAAFLAAAAIYALNAAWLAFVGRRGVRMLIYAAAILPFELTASFGGGAWGVISYHLLRRRY